MVGSHATQWWGVGIGNACLLQKCLCLMTDYNNSLQILAFLGGLANAPGGSLDEPNCIRAHTHTRTHRDATINAPFHLHTRAHTHTFPLLEEWMWEFDKTSQLRATLWLPLERTERSKIGEKASQ